jgi:hypothetical protein
LVIAAVVAARQVKEARRLREAQAQPFVVVDLVVEEPRYQEIFVVISNIGGTMARNVHLKFDPELTSSLDSKGVTPPRELKPLRDGIPSLPPGKEIRVMFDIFTQRDAARFPDVYEVEISFDAPALKRNLKDHSVLDLGVYRNVLHGDRRDVHDVHERLKELVAETRKWTALPRGLLVLDPKAVRTRDAAILASQRDSMMRRLFRSLRSRLRPVH